MKDPQALDEVALGLIVADVAALTDKQLDLPTPCDGWTVRDLVAHMNREHIAVIDANVGPQAGRGDDPQAAFPRIIERWRALFTNGRSVVRIPKMGRDVPAERVLEVHFVDMLVHRWDLARAVGRTLSTPTELTDIAIPLAQTMAAPGSPLRGPDGVYDAPAEIGDGHSPIERLVALLGRDPAWPDRGSRAGQVAGA